MTEPKYVLENDNEEEVREENACPECYMVGFHKMDCQQPGNERYARYKEEKGL